MGTVLGKDIEVDVRSSGSSSKRPSKDSSPQKSGGNSNKVYAELISDGSLPSDLPTIKVLINDSLATTAVDQLRDSQVAAHELSKSLIVDVLTDKHTPPKLGIILQSIFSYESLLQPTRDLIYWSIQIPSTFNPIYQQTKQTLNYVDRTSYQSIADLSESWLLHPQTRTQLITPLLRWTMEQPTISIDPLTRIAAANIPEWKNETREAIKSSLLEYLRSDDAKDVVRNGIVKFLSKDDPSSSAAE